MPARNLRIYAPGLFVWVFWRVSLVSLLWEKGKFRIGPILPLSEIQRLSEMVEKNKSSWMIIYYCLIGRYCPDADKFPIKCSLGTASTSSKLYTACPPCLPGSYADTEGLAYCIKCPPGFVCPSSTRIAPWKCPSNMLARQTTCLDNIHIGWWRQNMSF
jgi:hypothetical protein